MVRAAFIGLGLMGMPMARNLRRAVDTLIVHNRSAGRTAQLVAEGLTGAGSGAEAARLADLVFSCVPGPADVRALYLRPGGVVEGLRTGQIVCEMSTIDPATHREVAAAVQAQGAHYLDAPVSGGTSGAREGTLSIMIGGDAAALARIRPQLQAMGKNIYHMGPVGAGAATKLVNQMMGAICALGVVEGLVLGVRAGLDPDQLYEVLSTSSGASRALTGHGPNILSRNFEPGFTIDLQYKDVSLAVQMARDLGVPTVAGGLAEQVIQTARALRLGSRSNAAVVQPLERAVGFEVRSKRPNPR